MTSNGSKKIIAILLIFVFIFAGCTQQPANKSTGSGLMTLDANKTDTNKGAGVYNNLDNFKKVKVGDQIKVDYVGRLKDGTVFDSSFGREPLAFEVGAGQMIKGFDAAVVGMKIGEVKTVELAPADAYGEYDKRKVATFDANKFADFAQLQIGMSVQSNFGAGKVIEKNDTNAVIDFNHELAGKVLVFEITLVSIN